MNRFKKYYLAAMLTGAVAFTGAFALAGANNASKAAGGAYSVDLKEGRANPDSLAVAVGKAVQFNAKDGKKYNFALGEGGEHHGHSGSLSSGDFGEGQAWRATFSKPGTYFFHDHYNPNVNVLIVVYQPKTN